MMFSSISSVNSFADLHIPTVHGPARFAWIVNEKTIFEISLWKGENYYYNTLAISCAEEIYNQLWPNSYRIDYQLQIKFHAHQTPNIAPFTRSFHIAHRPLMEKLIHHNFSYFFIHLNNALLALLHSLIQHQTVKKVRNNKLQRICVYDECVWKFYRFWHPLTVFPFKFQIDLSHLLRYAKKINIIRSHDISRSWIIISKRILSRKQLDEELLEFCAQNTQCRSTLGLYCHIKW